MTREDVFDYVKKTYQVSPDYPFRSFPNYAVMRHQKNRKWFGLIMDVSKDKLGLDGNEIVTVLNVKVDRDMTYFFRDNINYLKAYHMNIENWISIVLDNIDDSNEICKLIDDSFDLTSK